MKQWERGGSQAATLVIAFLLSMVPACEANAVPSPATTSGVPEGRYAVQWETYVAGFAGEDLFAQLAFIDKRLSSAGAADPQINELLLLADGKAFPATVEAITDDSEPGDAYSLFTALVRVSPLPLGQHTITRVEFSDEHGQRASVQVGSWLVDIRPDPGPSPLAEGATSVGATELSPIEATLTNTSSADVAITGFIVDAPRWSPVTRLGTAGAFSTAAPEDEPVAGPEVEIVDVVWFGAHQQRTLYFELRSDRLQAQPFITLRPLYSYEIDGSSRLGPLPLQVYFRPFEGDADIERYLAGLPATARVTLGQ